MNNKFVLEIATFTLEGALMAAESGAHRIELCENAKDGGNTPSFGTLKVAKELINIPMFPIIRPRGGNFVYSDEEFESMKEDIKLCKQLKYEGVVFGILHENGQVDMERNSMLVQLASPMKVTFHRAFDRCADPLQALEEIIDCGFHRILTSGQYPNIMDGLELIQHLIKVADNRIVIMPGSGLNSSNIQQIALQTGAIEFHSGARKMIENDSTISPETMNEKLSFVGVDQVEIKAMLHQLDLLEKE